MESHGSNEFGMNLNNESEILEDQLEEYALKLSAKDFASRSKAKAKPQRREPAGFSPRIVPIERRNWLEIDAGKYLSEYEVSKKVIYLFRHSQQVHREEDGAVHFWRMKENLQNQIPQSTHWSDEWWKSCLTSGGGVRKEIPVLYWWSRNSCLFPSSSRTFRTQSYWSFIAGQWYYSEQLLPAYLPYWMCVQSSFQHQLWINTWRSEFQ